MNNIFLGGNNAGQNPFLPNTTNTNPTEFLAQQRAQLEMRLQQLKDAEQNFTTAQQAPQASQKSLWAEIDTLTSDLSDNQYTNLMKDAEYAELDKEIGLLLNEAMIAQAKPIVEASENGRSLLEKMVKLTKSKKATIVQQTNKELELFNQFQEYAKANPKATYDDFLKSQKKK